MKKFNYLLLALFLFASCQNNKNGKEANIEETKKTETVDLKDCYEKLQTITEKEDYILLSEQFKLSSSAETKKWIPNYYTSYCLIEGSFLEEDNEVKDSLLEIAQLFLDECFEIDSTESEFYILQTLLYASAMSVDPAMRARALAEKSREGLYKAKELNENNPRLYFIMGTGTMFRPVEYGGGPENALPLLELASEKFKSFKSDILFYPDWGKDKVEEYIEKCKQQL